MQLLFIITTTVVKMT